MIFTVLLNFFYSLISLLVGLLPVGNLPAIITSSFATLFVLANQFSYVVPIATLMQALAVVLVFDGSVLLWHFLNWIIRKIPGMS